MRIRPAQFSDSAGNEAPGIGQNRGKANKYHQHHQHDASGPAFYRCLHHKATKITAHSSPSPATIAAFCSGYRQNRTTACSGGRRKVIKYMMRCSPLIKECRPSYVPLYPRVSLFQSPLPECFRSQRAKIIGKCHENSARQPQTGTTSCTPARSNDRADGEAGNQKTTGLIGKCFGQLSIT